MRKRKFKKITSEKEKPKKLPLYPEFIKDKYVGQEVHVVAGGPSLVGFDYSKLKGKNVIAVNHAFKLVENDFCVFADKGFAIRESPDVIEKAVCVSRQNQVYPNNIIIFTFARRNFSMNPEDGVWHSTSSGSIGICAALQGGASKVYIYGFDCRFLNRKELIEAAQYNGDKDFMPKKDFYGHNTSMIYQHEQDENEQVFRDTIQLFSRFPRDKILNMSKFSAIPYFEKSTKPYID